MKITENKVKTDKNGKPVQQQITWSDPYEEVKATYMRRGNKTVLTSVNEKRKD